MSETGARLLISDEVQNLFDAGKLKDAEVGSAYWSGVEQGFVLAEKIAQDKINIGELIVVDVRMQQTIARFRERNFCTYQYTGLTNDPADYKVECRVNGLREQWGTAPGNCPFCHGPILEKVAA